MDYSQQQDELAQLFAQLSTQNVIAHQQQQQAPPTTVSLFNEKQQLQHQQPQVIDVPPIHYASVHYTPTAHIRLGDSHSEPSRSPPPPYLDAVLPPAMADVLRQHSIDPAALTPNQIQLFANADYEQRLRLLELWRIAPPSYPTTGGLQNFTYSHEPTSIVREELDAKFRYEQQMQQQQTQPRSVPHNHAQMRSEAGAAEPYMLRGYEQMTDDMAVAGLSPTAADPVYAAAIGSSGGLWQAQASAQTQQQQQETRYYEQIRNHADWERMNEQWMQERLVGAGMGRDEEMVM